MQIERQGGQALLIVVLVMVVVLTVGLSVASRSIVNLRLTTEEQQSQRAFSAAEAGIEQALRTRQGLTNPQELGNSAQIKEVILTALSGRSFLLNGGNPVIKDEGIDVWLADHNLDGTINYSSSLNPDFFTLYWGSSSDGCANAALEVIVISSAGEASSATAKRYAYDSCSSRRNSNNFSTPDTNPRTVEGKTFFYNTNVTGDNRIRISSGLVVRVIPLYSNTPMTLFMCNPSNQNNNCTSLPSQGTQIESTGVSGDTIRKVTLFQGYPSLSSEFFSHVLFCAKGSGGSSCTMQ